MFHLRIHKLLTDLSSFYCTCLLLYCYQGNILHGTVPYQQRQKLVFLHPSILQTDCRKYLLKRLFRLQISINFGSTGSATLLIKLPVGEKIHFNICSNLCFAVMQGQFYCYGSFFYLQACCGDQSFRLCRIRFSILLPATDRTPRYQNPLDRSQRWANPSNFPLKKLKTTVPVPKAGAFCQFIIKGCKKLILRVYNSFFVILPGSGSVPAVPFLN